MLLYLWLILTIPTDRQICQIWTNLPPSQVQLVQSCGTADLSPYRLDVQQNGITLCTKPAAQLYTFLDDCALPGKWDDYRLNIVQPNYQTSLCSVTTPENNQPTKEVIYSQCPDAKKYPDVVVRSWGTKIQETPPPMCKPPAVQQPASIATSHELHLLSGKLIWYGYVKVDCHIGIYSSMSPLTPTPCALDAARPAVFDWQNSMDAEILKASAEWNVPAPMLKQMIENETQFWAWTGSPQEHGLIQATDYAAHAVLHVYEARYYVLTPTQQASARAAWLNQLDCQACDPKQTLEHAKRNMSRYAQVFAAYYCMYGSWPEALRAWNVKYQEN